MQAKQQANSLFGTAQVLTSHLLQRAELLWKNFSSLHTEKQQQPNSQAQVRARKKEFQKRETAGCHIQLLDDFQRRLSSISIRKEQIFLYHYNTWAKLGQQLGMRLPNIYITVQFATLQLIAISSLHILGFLVEYQSLFFTVDQLLLFLGPVHNVIHLDQFIQSNTITLQLHRTIRCSQFCRAPGHIKKGI